MKTIKELMTEFPKATHLELSWWSEHNPTYIDLQKEENKEFPQFAGKSVREKTLLDVANDCMSLEMEWNSEPHGGAKFQSGPVSVACSLVARDESYVVDEIYHPVSLASASESIVKEDAFAPTPWCGV